MARDRVDVDRCVGRSADRRARDDRVLEGFAGENVRWFQIFMHDRDRTPPSLIGDLRAFAIGRGDGGAAGQRYAQCLGKGVHGRGGAHRVAMADGRRG